MVVPATPDLVVDAPAAQPPAQAPAPAASSQAFDSLEDLFKTNGASSQPATAADTAPPKTETAKTDQPEPEKPATQQAAAPEMDADALERLAQTDPNAFRTWVRAHHDHPLAKLVQAEASDQARRANQRAVAAAADATKAQQASQAQQAEFDKIKGLLQRAYQQDDWPDREAARDELLGPMRESFERYQALMDPVVTEQVATTVQQQVQGQLEAVGRDAYVQATRQATTHKSWQGLPADVYAQADQAPSAPDYYDVLYKARTKAENLLGPKEVDARIKQALEDERLTGYSRIPPYDNTPSSGTASARGAIDISLPADQLIAQGLQDSRASRRT